MQFIPTRAFGGFVAAAALLGLTACADNAVQSDPTQGVSYQATGAPANEQLARLLAAALRNPELRSSVHQAIQASPVTAGKLHFATFLRGNGRGLASEMARAGGTSEAEVFALLGRTKDLEMYLPVDEHRTLWTGGTNLIVATSLTETGAPFGVDLDGRAVALLEETPPSVPTLAIVPSESFGRDGQPFAGQMKGAAAGPRLSRVPAAPRFYTASYQTQQRNIGVEEYASHMRALDDHEPWWKDDAEFYVMFAGTTNVNGSPLTSTVNVPSNIWTNSTGWKELSVPLKLFMWDTDYGTRVKAACRERDDNDFNVTLSVKGSTEIFGQTINFEGQFKIDDDDDACGEQYVTPRLSTGQWTLIPNGVNPIYDGTSDLHWYGFGLQNY